MASREETLIITRVRAASFRTEGGQNFLVQLRATTGDGRTVEALGEAMPRGAHTGDLSGDSWDLLTECLGTLEGRAIPASDPGTALASVHGIIEDFALRAGEKKHVVKSTERARRAAIPKGAQPRPSVRRTVKRAIKLSIRFAVTYGAFWRRPKPFQGTLAGIEAALVDLVSKALDRPWEELAGRRAATLRPLLPHPYGSSASRHAVFERTLRRMKDSVAFPAPPAPTHNGEASTVYEEVPYLKPLGSNGTKGHLLEREALALGLTTTRYSKGAFSATDGVHPPLIFKWSRTPRSSAVSLALCTHKEATRMLLGRAGVPVPRGRTFANGDFESAKAFATRIGYPVVVKPAMGVRGIGVVANIADEQELQRAFDHLVQSRLGRDEFIVEKHLTGRDYRIVVVGDEVIAAILREPASVEGDGEHTVAELIVNKNTFRQLNPHLWGRPIKYDDAARYQLERAGLNLTSIPEPGRKVFLSNTCSLSQGGDSIDVLDELHPSIKDACLQAVRAVPGLWFCGIDFLIDDHTKPLSAQVAGVCELNAHAAIGNCEYPLYGTPRDVARTVMAQTIDHYGLQVNDKPAEQLALKLTVRGQVRGVGYRTWMQRHATNFGLSGWVRNTDGGVEVVLVGDTVPTSALAAAAVLGPRRAKPTSVTTEHIPPPAASGFRILEDHVKEDGDAR